MKPSRALEQSLLLALCVAFTVDPGHVAWLGAEAAARAAQRQARGEPTALERALGGARRLAGGALDALDRWLCPRLHALEPDDLVLSEVPDAYLDLSSAAGATALPLAGDEESVAVSLGFELPYYTDRFQQVVVTTNGHLLFGSALSPAEGQLLPSEALPNAVIAPFWDDLDLSLSPSARVAFLRLGRAPNRAFVVEWRDVPLRADPGSRLTFEAILLESGEVQFHYRQLRNGDGSTGGRAAGARASVGLESPDGRRGALVSFHSGALAEGRSFAFTAGGPPLARGQLRGDLDRDGRVTVLDQSRLVEAGHVLYRPATARELLLEDVAPRALPDAAFGDGRVDLQDRDAYSLAIVRRQALNPVLARLVPSLDGSTLVLEGSGFAAAADENEVFFTTAVGGLGVPASAVDAAGTELTLAVPAGVVAGPVRVIARGLTTNALRYVPPGRPVVTGVFPSVARVGDQVTLHGLELAAGVEVLVSGVAAQDVSILEVDDDVDRLTFVVPDGVATGATSVVVRRAGVESPAFPFAVADDPVAALLSPSPGDEVRGPVSIVGTATDPTDFVSYTLTLERLADGGTEVEVGGGTASVVSGTLGTLDPTLLVNGFYTLRLRVRDALGLETSATSAELRVEGEQKVGAVRLSFLDLNVPVGGVPVSVIRTYDSREKRSQDFGVGWRLSVQVADVEEDLAHNVFVTLPDGRREVFRFQPTLRDPLRPDLFRIRFVAPRGVYDRLTVPDEEQDLFLVFGRYLTLEGEEFDPTDYVLVLREGTTFSINEERGVERIEDLNGNVVTFAPDGIRWNGQLSVTFARDAEGRVTQVTDPAGQALRYEYDARGDLVAVTSRRGSVTRFVYDARHLLTAIVDPQGTPLARNEYDDAGRLVAAVAADGARTEYAYDLGGRTEAVTDALGNTSVLGYDEHGAVVRARDPLGNETSFEYDAQGNQVAQVDALGARTARTFDAQGNLLTVTDPLGNVTRWTYDDGGRVTSVTDPLGNVTRLAFDAQGNLTSVTDPLGATSTLAYDAFGNLLSVTDALGATTRLENDRIGRPTAIVDALGNRTELDYDAQGNLLNARKGVRLSQYVFVTAWQVRWVYDAAGLLVEQVDALGSRSRIERDALGRETASTDALGRTTTYGYDAQGRLVATTAPDGTTVRQEFDALGRRTAVVDEAGRRTSFAYDAAGRPTETRFADGTAVVTSYDAVGREVSRTSPLGFASRTGYDLAGRIAETIDPLGARTALEYDAGGRVQAVEDAAGLRTSLEYDAAGTLTRKVRADGSVLQYRHDALGRVVATVGGDGHETRFEYDALGRRTAIVDAEGAATRFEYDTLSRLVARTDALGRVTRFRYDAGGRLAAVERPLGGVQRLEYDSIGRITTFTTFGGQTVSYEYDAASRVARRRSSDGRTVDFVYSATGARTSVLDSARGLTRYVYDDLDRLLERIDPDGLGVQYGYDADGRRVSVTTPAGTTRYAYDPVGRPVEVTDQDGGVTGYTYDARGRPTVVAYPNGVETRLAYNEVGRLTGVTSARPGETIASYAYALSPGGRRLSVTEGTGRAIAYAYDRVGRLTQESILDPGAAAPRVATYALDLVGNRVLRELVLPDGTQEATAYTYDADDRLLEETTVRGTGTVRTTYAYDGDGSLASSTGPDGVRRFTWTPYRRMATATLPGAPGGDPIDLRFTYDHDGTAVERWRGSAGARYLRDDAALSPILEERDAATGAARAVYTRGLGIVAQRRGAARRFYLRDGQASVRHLVDEGGVVTDRYDYDAFGVLVDRAGPTENVFRYAGGEEDPDLGTYALGARHYAPWAGRFLSEDALDRDGLSFHKYLYARGDPVSFGDPTGRFGMLLEAVFTTSLWEAILGDYILGYLAPLAATAYEGAEALSIAAEEMAVTATALADDLGVTESDVPGGDPVDASTLFFEEDPDEDLEGEGESCFLAGTWVETEAGPRPIEALTLGERVRSRDERTGEVGWKPVVGLFRTTTEEVVSVALAPAEPAADAPEAGLAPAASAAPPARIRCTPGHRWYVPARGWVRAGDLRVGDRLVGARGEALAVVGVVVAREPARVFNLDVSEWHTYFVAGAPDTPAACVHNQRLWRRATWALNIMIRGSVLERAGRRFVRLVGERTLSAGYRAGAARRGFDWLSIRGQGSGVRLVVNEAKNYTGSVPTRSFTSFGLSGSRRAAGTLDAAIDAAREHIRAGVANGRITERERDILLQQLDDRTFDIRLVGRHASSTDPGTTFSLQSLQALRGVTGGSVTTLLIPVP